MSTKKRRRRRRRRKEEEGGEEEEEESPLHLGLKQQTFAMNPSLSVVLPLLVYTHLGPHGV
jgi:hypothetical protein